MEKNKASLAENKGSLIASWALPDYFFSKIYENKTVKEINSLSLNKPILHPQEANPVLKQTQSRLFKSQSLKKKGLSRRCNVAHSFQ